MAKPRARQPRKLETAGPGVDARYTSVVNAVTKNRGVVVEPGWGAGNFVLKVNGKIFAILSADRFVAKLPKGRVDELVADGSGTRFDPRKNGRVMKEWLVVPDPQQWRQLVREAHEFVSTSTRV